ncbi:MAG: HlyD family secretion protein [Hyphomicrobiales bacterium]|nr:HlyD family secretion protein [Hyphomicrobiales bacterium]
MAEPARQLDIEPQRPTLTPVTSEAPTRDIPRDAAPRAPIDDRTSVRTEKKRSLRGALLLLGPFVVVVGGLWMYLSGGRYATTDDAYVKADIVNVADDVSGIVTSVNVKEGQIVKKGDLLFVLDDQPYRIALDGAKAQLGIVANQLTAIKANYNAARAQAEQAKADLDYYKVTNQRQADLAARGVAAQAALDQAKRDYIGAQSRLIAAQKQADALLAQLGGKPDDPVEQNPQYLAAKAAVDKAARDLEHTRVYASIAGVVTNVAQLQPGNYLPASQVAFNLVSRENMWVEANLKETDLANVKMGDPATVAVDAYSGKSWQAHVASIVPAAASEFSVLPAQNTSGNWVKVVQRLTVRLAVDHPADAPQMRAGMSVYASIDTGVKRSLATLPRDLARMIGL